MLSKSRLKGKHPCLIFVKVHIRDKGSLGRRLVMIKTKNQMTLMPRCTGQKFPEDYEHEYEHSCNDPSHMMSTLSPQFLVISIMYCQTLLFILNLSLIDQAEVAYIYINNSLYFSSAETWSL